MKDKSMNAQVSVRKRKISGVLLLDKPHGLSSNAALQRVRRLYSAEKAGHTGVLDPLATGLLPICFGEATKFAQYLLNADKTYTATLKLGEATTTGDAEGEVMSTGHIDVEAAHVDAAIAAFSGAITQIPPMYSALKHQGKPLYAYARANVIIPREARQVFIHEIEVLHLAAPELILMIRCSKGTYIRILAEDLAKHMGTVAHLTALRRTATAGFDIKQSHQLVQLEESMPAQLDELLLPCDVLLQHLPQITLTDADISRLQHGLTVHFDKNCATIQPLRLYRHSGQFIGLVQFQPVTGCLKALRLMSTASQ